MEAPVTAKGPTYKYSSLRYVDKAGSNFLFRGPSPCLTTPDGMIYDHKNLIAAMRRVLPDNVPLPDDFMLMNLCLLYDNEVQEVTTIIDFFERNPNFGSVTRVNNVIGVNPDQCYFTVDEPTRQHLLETFNSWLSEPLMKTVDMIQGWLEFSPFPLPVIVYVHCDGGCDRTAEIIGAYKLRYMGATWADLSDDRPCEWVGGDPRPLGCNNYRALEWHAAWLSLRGYSVGNIGVDDAGCADPAPINRHWPCSGPGAQNCF